MDSELGHRVVHNHYNQTKNGSNGNGNGRTNNILLTCLIAIVGFVGLQVWLMNGEVKAMSATMQLIVQGRIRLPNPDQ